MRLLYVLIVIVVTSLPMIASSPLSPMGIKEDHFDLIELNHMHNEHGFPTFDQVIFYDWVSVTRGNSRFKAQAWRLMKDSKVETEEGKVRHEKVLDEYVKRFSADRWGSIRSICKYRGEFVGGRLMPELHRNGYRMMFHEDGVLRIITAKHFRETWTQEDPEHSNRKWFPENSRRGLTE